MSLFKISDSKLLPIKEINFESYFDREKKLQNFTEHNLETLFSLKFVSTEFNLETFWLDSLAFDPFSKSFVIIEYKKVENFSLMDQGQTYLNLLLDHKGDILQEYLEKTGKPIKKSEVDWSQTRVIFIGPKFTTYQRRALSPNLPFELWEVALYDNGLIEYDAINPVGTGRMAEKKSLMLSGSAAKEIKTYTVEDVMSPKRTDQVELFRFLQSQLLSLGDLIQERVTLYYVAYRIHGTNIVYVNPRSHNLMLDIRITKPQVPTGLKLVKPKQYAWDTTPTWRTFIENEREVDLAMIVIKQAYAEYQSRYQN